MWRWFKYWLNRYDLWCCRMGLTPAQKRSCVAYREDVTDDDTRSPH